jgi:hypothetical protein
MKDSDELLREYVLRAICDDYEEIERILAKLTAGLGGKASLLTVRRSSPRWMI